MEAEIGIVGGSGLYAMEQLQDTSEVDIQTPWGSPSDSYLLGTMGGRRVAFLARHGRGHRIMPSELNFRANIYGFKKLGVTRVISISAVGSLKQEHRPLEFIIPDQFYDHTKRRVSTFFGDGVAVHISFADPVCPELTKAVYGACQAAGVVAKLGGTYICIEGPNFSTQAESRLYRSWGMDVIGMTNVTEAKLAREAELCYATMAMVTDYDVWHPEHDTVTVAQIVENLLKNAANACQVVVQAVERMPRQRACKCGSALEHAIITDRAQIPPAARQKLELLIGKYL